MSVPARRDVQAFLDESQSDRARDPFCYLLAAAVCDIGQTRLTMECLRLRGQTKVHWRDESDKRRREITTAVGALSLQHLVIVRDGRAHESGERQRRFCLERMLFELDQLQVHTATFESRGSADDRRDRAMLDALRARKVVTSALRIVHTPGPKDALLWVPDVVCGAVTQDRTGDGRYLEGLATRLRIVTITTD